MAALTTTIIGGLLLAKAANDVRKDAMAAKQQKELAKGAAMAPPLPQVPTAITRVPTPPPVTTPKRLDLFAGSKPLTDAPPTPRKNLLGL